RAEIRHARVRRAASAGFRWAANLGGTHACAVCGVQFGFDVRQEQDAIRWRADRLRDAQVRTALMLAADFRVEETVEQRCEVARRRITEKQFLCLHRSR